MVAGLHSQIGTGTKEVFAMQLCFRRPRDALFQEESEEYKKLGLEGIAATFPDY